MVKHVKLYITMYVSNNGICKLEIMGLPFRDPNELSRIMKDVCVASLTSGLASLHSSYGEMYLMRFT